MARSLAEHMDPQHGPKRILALDGGVSPHNNPALQMLMLALFSGHGYNWHTGPENLSIVSVGTGTWKTRRPAELSWKDKLVAKATSGVPAVNGLVSLQGLMADTSALNETLLQWLGTSSAPREIDSEIGDLALDGIASQNLFRYERFDAPLELDWLRTNVDSSITAKKVKQLRAMDRASSLEGLWKAGEAIAQTIEPEMLA